MDRAARRPQPIPVYAEMGSINPIVVTEAALAARGDAIADGLVASVATFGGQLCTKPGVVLVPEGPDGDAFAAAVAAARRDRAEVLLNERAQRRARRGASSGSPAPDGRRRPRPAPEDAGAATATSPSAFQAPAATVARRLARCSRSTSARSSSCCATPPATSCSTRSPASRGSSPPRCTREPDEDADAHRPARRALAARAGRVIFDGFPTGVAVTHGMHHGGPYPAASSGAHTSVGMTAIRRFLRPVAFQDAPQAVLPPELRDANPLGIWRRVDGELTKDG